MNNEFENNDSVNNDYVNNKNTASDMPTENLEMSETSAETANDSDAMNEDMNANVESAVESTFADKSEKVNAIYNPQNDTYSYSKPNLDSKNGAVNGCVWDKSQANGKKKSSKGFKVFTVAMLSVFTLSVAAIAVFMTADFVKDHVKVKTNASVSITAPGASASTSLISTFSNVNEGLTKSQVAMKCTPSAVGIVVDVETNSGYYGYSFFGENFSYPQVTQGVGSGFIYNTDGYIVTNHHVVEDAKKITVYLSDKTQVEAELVGFDELSDIAVIKINPEGLNLVPMSIGDSDSLVVGDEVIAIGCPAGIEYMNTVTDGIISAINRDVELNESGKAAKKTMTLLQTNATINRGNSGGALINAKGEVVGINTLKLASDYEGIGFSIPINGAAPIIKQLIEYGKVMERSENTFVSSEGVIGISASAISKSEADYYDIPQGILVVQINKDSSAAKAGLKRGDIITAYNGKEVKTVEELNNLKASNKAGDEVTVSVYRDSDSNTFNITFKLDMA